MIRHIVHIIYDTGSFDRHGDYVSCITLDWAYGTATDADKDAFFTLYAIDFYPDLNAAFTATGCTADPTSERGELKMNASVDSLQEVMQPLFKGNVVYDETVLFIDPGDTVRLLYSIDEVISVTSFDRRTTYVEGRDYEIVNGCLKITESSTIPTPGSDLFYNYPGSIINTMHNGKQAPMYWGENDTIYKWQVCVSYTHSDGWTDFYQPSEAAVYRDFIAKLQDGKDVTVLFLGDSITYGANASFLFGGGTGQHSFPMLVVESLADIFGYKVRFVPANLGNTSNVPKEYGTGGRGTITYINTAVGGWNSGSIVENYDRYCGDFVSQYGCDLLIFAHGMNDGGQDPVKWTVRNAETVFDRVLSVVPDVAIMYVSTMLPNPEGIGWTTTQPLQESYLQMSAAAYRAKGIPCAVCCMTSTSRAVLDHKRFMDYTGNNVNHPNDFFSRIYAQTIFQTLIGYENLS